MEIEARIEPGSLRRVVQASRTWDAKARAEMRRGLRRAAEPAADRAKAEVTGPTPDGKGAGTTGLRGALAKGVTVAIRTGREGKDGLVRGEGVRVTTSSKKLDEGDEPMVKAYMARVFRHPVFGSDRWVYQFGKNWFYGPLMDGREAYRRAVVDAIRAANEAIK